MHHPTSPPSCSSSHQQRQLASRVVVIVWLTTVQVVDATFRPLTFAPSVHCQSSHFYTSTVNTATVGEEAETVTIDTSIRLSVSLGESVCARILLPSSVEADNSSSTATGSSPTVDPSFTGQLFLAIKYELLEQHYPVRSFYTFAVPHIHTNCVCRCGLTPSACKSTFLLKENGAIEACQSDAQRLTCRAQHHQFEQCGDRMTTHWCCDLILTPVNQSRYTAITLAAAKSVAVLSFNYHHIGVNNESVRLVQHEYRVPLAQQQTIQLVDKHVKARVLSTPNEHGLGDGQRLYVHEAHNDSMLMGGVHINDIDQHDLNRLGWFRYDGGKWTVRHAEKRLSEAHSMRTLDCLANTYEHTMELEQYTLHTQTKNTVQMGEPLLRLHNWMSNVSLQLGRRQLVIEQKTDHTLQMEIVLSNIRAMVTQLKHGDRVGDFNASLQMDRHGRQYANISFVNCTGTLLGELYGAGQRSSKIDLTFSVKLSGHHVLAHRIVRLASLSSTDHRWVCFMLAAQHDRRLCKLAKFEATMSSWFTLGHEHSWGAHEGDCAMIHCDVDTQHTGWWTQVVDQLSPDNWFTEDMTWYDRVTTILKLIMAVLALLLAAYVCKTCCLPLFRCAFGCGGGGSGHVLQIKLDKTMTDAV